MWHLILYYYTISCFYFTFFFLLRTPRDKFHNLKRLIRFNYNPLLIIITIFQTESFHLLNWKVSQLKCISLIKLTLTLKTFFLLEWNFFTDKRVEMKDAQKVHKKLFYCTDIYVYGNFVFCFISLLFDYQWNSRISSSLKPFFKFFIFLFYYIKTN